MLIRTESNGSDEREMSRHQRGFVNTCFEEGQYESAISVLDQLRSSKYRPAASHIRQLLYIALYPPATNDEGEGRAESGPFSPRKAAKQHTSPLFPSPTASSAAQRLLVSYAHTNSPSGIFRALPSYSETSNGSQSIGRDGGGDEEDSYSAKEAMLIEHSKDCWSILRPGFIQRKQLSIDSPKDKGNKRTRDVFEEEYSEEQSGEFPTIVAEHAWPVLDWFLNIFEQDEVLTEDQKTTRYSPLLLSQIPCPGSATKARWEIDAPLEIVFHCFQQTDQKRRAMGARLMTSLISLTSTTYLDIPMFVASVVGRLSSSSIEEFSALFSSLAPSPVIARFKVALCQRYLTYISFDGETLPDESGPKARAQPKAVRRNVMEDSGSPAKSTGATSAAVISKHGLPRSSEVLRLIEKNLADSSPPAVVLTLRVKFELLVTYGIAQGGATADSKDPEWLNIVHDGRLGAALDAAFAQPDGSGRVYRETLKSIITAW